MYFGDHHPAYFHAEYGEHHAIIKIETLALIAGTLPPRAMGLVAEWASLHRQELVETWRRAHSLESVDRIEPLP